MTSSRKPTLSARELYASYQRGDISDLPAAVEEHMPAWQANHERRMSTPGGNPARGIGICALVGVFIWSAVLWLFGHPGDE